MFPKVFLGVCTALMIGYLGWLGTTVVEAAREVAVLKVLVSVKCP